MTSLYQVAAANNGIVVGTGNKVEDFGVGFYTKYGDGGVDISPIADCTKTEVWEMGNYLGIPKEIIEAEPTDGLWDDGRSDVKQLGMSYHDLEKAMKEKDLLVEIRSQPNSGRRNRNWRPSPGAHFLVTSLMKIWHATSNRRLLPRIAIAALR